MEKTIFMIGSITHAYQARNFLAQHGYNGCMKNVRKNMTSSGCGYSITVEGDFDSVYRLLQSAGVRITGYKRLGSV